MSYDDWKLQTPPEYERMEREADWGPPPRARHSRVQPQTIEAPARFNTWDDFWAWLDEGGV